MGLFALLARFVPHFSRRKDRPQFAAAPLAPHRLERRRVFDGAAAGVVLEAIPDVQPYVQTSESLLVSDEAVDQAQPAAAIAGLPQTTIRLRSAEIFEDQSVLAVIDIVDSPPMAHQITIDWGDGSPLQVINVGPTVKQTLAVHKFLDDNPSGTSSDTYTVTATVTNTLGGSATSSTTILVKNIAPKIDSFLINSSTINENDSVTLTGTYSDPGTLDTHELDIDWDGDNLFDQTISVSGGTFSVTRQILDDDPTGTPSDTFNVKIRLRDDDGGVDTNSTMFTVSNLNPEFLSVTVTSPINENGVATLTGTYKDTGTLDTHELDIDWDGDGNFDETVIVSGGSFSVNRQFLDDPAGLNDNITINVRLRDDDGGVATAATTVTVENVNPIVVLNPLLAIDENGTAVLSGTYSDAGTLDTHELDIDWDGDNLFDQTIVVTGGAFTVTRQFLDDNPTGTSSDTFNVNVRLRDDDGGAGTDSQPLTVSNLNPTLTLDPLVPILENGTAVLKGTYADEGSLDTHEIDIDWDGDGSFDETITVTGGAFTVSRQFLDDDPTGTPSDTFDVTVRLRDDDTGEHTAKQPLTVNNVNPVLVLNPIATINENDSATVTGTYTDVGTQDTHEIDIDWDGDGNFDQTATVSGGTFMVTRQFLDDNPSGTSSDTFDVTVRLRDDDGGDHTVKQPLTINNLNPMLVLDPLADIDENGTAILTGTFSDVGTQDTHELEIDWDGDNVFDQTVTVTGGAFSVSRQFLDDNPTGTPSDTFNVNVRLRDDDGGLATASQPLTIKNVDPIVVLDPLTDINENGTAVLSGTYTDAGTLDTHELDIDWDGDNLFDQTIVVTGGAFTVTRQFLDDNPTGTSSDTFNVNVRLRDDDGGMGTDSQPLTVNNVNPSVVLVPPAPIEENDFATLQGTISDVGTLDTFTLTINWGDPFSPNDTQTFNLGTTLLTEDVDGINWDPMTRTFSLDHQYLDDNPSMDPVNTYVIAAKVVDDDGGVGTANTTITVKNVNLVLDLADNQTVNEGSELDLTNGELGSFTDSGTQDTHTATVDWGDGSGIQSVLVTETSGSGELSAKHIYADNGEYTVRVTVIDDDGGPVSGTFKVNVQNVDPTLTGVKSPFMVVEGEEFSLDDLGVGLADPGFDNPSNPLGASQETFVAMTVDWGDGSAPTALNVDTRTNGGENIPTTGTLAHADHAYADDGLYTVSIVIRDDDGGFVTRTLTIMVENVDPDLTLTTRFLQINEGDTLNLFDLGTFTDPGFNNSNNPSGASTESFHYSVDWGDGTLTENNQSPASVIDGQQGITTKGTLADSHKYVDNDDDNLYTITVTLFDDDGGSDTHQIQVRVLNVNPSFIDVDPMGPNVIVATDVNNKGQTVLTIKFTDPGNEAAFLPNGLDPFQVLIDWGDQLSEPILDARFVVEDRLNGIPVGTLTYVHQYSGPPDPLNPSADITIRVKIRDDDFYTVTALGAIGQSVVATVDISNPGIGAEPFRIDTTLQVPQLDFPLRVEAALLVDSVNTNLALQQNVELRATSGDTQTAADRFIELRVIDAEGNEGPGYRLRTDVLQDLPGLFRKLPDNHYAVYVVNMETNTRRLVIEVYVRNGKLIDPGDDSEGTRDRPPTDEQTIQPAAEQGAEAAGARVKADQAAAVLPAFDFRRREQEFGSQRGFSRWSGLAVGLAASAASQSWVHRVDQALAQATSQQWRKLQGHNPPKPKNQ